MSRKKVKLSRCDNGREYINNTVFQFVPSKGIHLSPCPPYVYELNRVAERYNRSIMDMARCLLSEAQVSVKYWPEIVRTAAYLKNRTLANTVVKMAPYELFFKERSDVNNLRVYGSKVFVRTPDNVRKTKWDDKGQMGIVLGYSEVGYRVLTNDKIIEAGHVDIVENNIQCIGIKDDDINDRVCSKDDDIQE